MWLEQLARAVRLIAGSPADATIGARCSGGQPPIQPGDFCTYTQGGWGAACAGNNPGCIRDTNFSVVFQNGLFIGQGVTWTGASPNNGTNGTLDGVEPWAAKWTSSSAIENYLPAGGSAGRLTADLVNPTSTSSRVLDGQLVAATLNAAFNRAGVLVGNDASTKLADLNFRSTSSTRRSTRSTATSTTARITWAASRSEPTLIELEPRATEATLPRSLGGHRAKLDGGCSPEERPSSPLRQRFEGGGR